MKLLQVVVGLAFGLSNAVADYVPSDKNPSPFSNGAPAPSPVRGADYYIRPSPGPMAPSPKESTDAPVTTDAPVLGCIQGNACNFNPEATSDDGSCTYATQGADCDGNCLDSSPADCTGVCGGSAVCCPATCTATGSKTGMTCDEIGAAGDDSSATTCSTLEANGCDCTGCGCGIIIDDDGYEIEDGMEATGLTCDKTEKLASGGQPCNANVPCDATACKNYCTAADTCQFAAWNTQGGCILYNSCKITRTVASVTTTYHQVPTGQGLTDDGSCACTWWTCVNDGGLGYCA